MLQMLRYESDERIYIWDIDQLPSALGITSHDTLIQVSAVHICVCSISSGIIPAQLDCNLQLDT